MLNVSVENYQNKLQGFKNCVPLSFRNGNLKTDGQVDLVLCCVDNFEARMTVNIVSTSTSFDTTAEACLLLSLWSEMAEWGELQRFRIKLLTHPCRNQDK